MNNVIETTNIVSPEEASRIIEKSVKMVIDHPEKSSKIAPILLRGPAGCGKSSIVRGIAEKLGIGFIDIRLAQREPVDLRGLPVPNKETKSVEWYVTSDLPRDPNSKGILFFDELTAADRSLQVASYELILDRRLGNLYKLPDGWFIVAAGNRTKDRAVATAMSSALANRLAHFEISTNAEDWGEWAVRNALHPSVTGYIQYKPGNLFRMEGQNLEQGWPTPRSWERVANAVDVYGDDEEDLRKMVYGLVGPGVGVEFMEFHRLNRNFDSVLEMLENPKAKIVIPTKSDEKYALTSAAAYLVWQAKTEEDIKQRVNGLYRIAMELSPDFATCLIKNCMQGNDRISRTEACKYIGTNAAYKDFAKKFGKAFSKKYEI